MKKFRGKLRYLLPDETYGYEVFCRLALRLFCAGEAAKN